MANANAPQAQAPKADEFDSKEITRLFARVKHELGGLIGDAYRVRPFYAPTKEEAIAKRDAAIKALNGLADSIDSIKKQGN
ncbi:hypothetical protein [Rathayibacter rathayi]|uniref:hypothetical protein n=1 Tax=Rathayibacter rathayi TaxID=33887 RepID=UPI0011B066DE|nr:hypothetical protein [Rathayibacter rathayi]